jgi:hypothetical protein
LAHTFSGRCHCGNIAATFETPTDPASLPLRECGCSFCRKHGARTTSDPEGTIAFQVHVPTLLSRYQFALRVGEMWVCARCGAYVASVMRDGAEAFATLNIRCLDDASAFTGTPQTVHYDDEDATARKARRRYLWTPVKGGFSV